VEKGKVVIISSDSLITEVIPDAYMKADCRAHRTKENEKFCKSVESMKNKGKIVLLISPLRHLDTRLIRLADTVIEVKQTDIYKI
jgi:hypothetical protein